MPDSYGINFTGLGFDGRKSMGISTMVTANPRIMPKKIAITSQFAWFCTRKFSGSGVACGVACVSTLRTISSSQGACEGWLAPPCVLYHNLTGLQTHKRQFTNHAGSGRNMI